MLFSATVALSLASLINAQSLGIAAIEAHFTGAGLVPSLLATFTPSATLNVTFTGVGAIEPGQALSRERELPISWRPEKVSHLLWNRGCPHPHAEHYARQQLRYTRWKLHTSHGRCQRCWHR